MHRPPFQLRGVVEGFYGAYYTFPERDDLIDFIGRHGYNTYIYGPKNDRQHRARWWEPYPEPIMRQFAATLAVARAAGVTFCYAIAPIGYPAAGDLGALTAKLRSFYDLGVRAFSIFLDDTSPAPDRDFDPRRDQGWAAPHVELCNQVYGWLQALSPACSLSVCPPEYHGGAPFGGYLRALGQGLRSEIDIFYTGPQVCSPTIGADDAAAFAQAAGRAPLIWDNYPVNDLAMRPELHIGPIRGRDPELHRAVRGVVVNPMLQPAASKIALLTWADYLRDPRAYQPAAAWERALREAGGAESFAALRLFAENARRSCLEPAEAPRMDELAQGALDAARGGLACAECPAARALDRYLAELDEACYQLKNRMDNLRLRADLLPWIEALECRVWLGKRALGLLDALDRGAPYARPAQLLEESLKEVGGLTRRIGGQALDALARYACERVAERAREDVWIAP